MIFCSATTDFRVCTGSKATGKVTSNVELYVRFAHEQRLRIGIDGNKFHTAKTGVNHAVQCVNATAADTDDLDNC